VALVLLSGRPGAGKTEYAAWLAQRHGFVHVETDEEWPVWGPLLCDDRVSAAHAVERKARVLGENVSVEWGFRVQLLDRVKQLRDVGFDTWWFDGDEAACRAGYIRRRGSDPQTMGAYWAQVNAIRAHYSEIREFYSDHAINVVEPGPTYTPFEDIAYLMFGDRLGRRGMET